MFTEADLEKTHSAEDVDEFLAAIKVRSNELEEQFAGRTFDAAAEDEFATMRDLKSKADARRAQFIVRTAWIAELGGDERKIERAYSTRKRPEASAVPEDVFDLGEYRNRTNSEETYGQALRDGAKKVAERAVYPHERARHDASAERLHKLLESVEHPADLAQRIIATGNPVYGRALGKVLSGRPNLTGEESRALATYTNSGADGGYAVPFTLDPTLLLTSDGVVNPLRQIARVETITGQEWKGVTSGSVTLSRVAENTAVTPTSPTLAQPRVVPTAVKGTIDFSIEVGQDWTSLQSEMARVLQDAKDAEESSSFVVGTGNGITGPEGIERVADTSIVWTQATGNFGVEDVYALETDPAGGNGLPPKFRPRASFLANKAIYNLIRQFSVGTVGEGSIWVRGIEAGAPGQLIGYPAYEASALDDTVADGNDILILGDFRNFIIVDRVGMSVELIPHMFDGDGKPLGKRGLWVMYRNSSAVLVDNAFRKLRVGEGS